MQHLLHPAIALMNRLRYPQKFLLISLLFVFPLALVLGFLIQEVNTKAAFSQKEHDGTVYLRAVRPLFEHALFQQVLAQNYYSGDGTLAADFQRAQAQIDADLAALAAVDRQLGPTLQTTAKLETLNAYWRDLKAKLPVADARTSVDLHATFVADIRSLIALVGDTSNLILDPDLDSYYTMDAVLIKLPEHQDLSMQLRLLGQRIITQQAFQADDKTQLTILSGLLRSNISALAQGMDVAFRNNPAGNLQPALSAPLQEMIIANEALLEGINREILFAPTIAIRPEAYRALADEALRRSFALWDRAVVPLDDLALARVDASNTKKNLVVIVTALVLALVLYLWIAFYVAVRRTVAELDLAARRMIGGDMAGTLWVDSRDELGDVVRSFNTIASALISSSAYRQAVVDNAVDGIITIAEDGRIDSINPAASRIFGYAPDDLDGQPFQQLVSPPHDREYQVVGVGREVVGRRKDGTEFPLELAIGEMRLADRHHYIGIAHDLSERKREAEERARLQERIIQAQAAALAELSTPVIPISDQVLVMPLVGAIDSERARQVLEALLHGIERSRARVAILDITGVPLVDTQVAKSLIVAAQAVRLLGARVVLTGIRPEVAQTIVGLGVDLGDIATQSTLQSGIAYAMQERSEVKRQKTASRTSQTVPTADRQSPTAYREDVNDTRNDRPTGA
ncbi:MAG TPA: PAS domain S-box protein [Roseiflexaceae bacterium]|nr:PAS domain S-box protein [Roseiflexaceae bacterium]